MWDEEEWDESEGPDEPDDDETVACPYCGEPVYEDAERCPHCERYLSREDAPPRRPWWLVVGVGAGLAAVAWWVLGR